MDIPSLDFDLGEDVELLRHTVREFAANEIAPLGEAADRDGQFPNELWPRLGELGVLGLTVEEQFGVLISAISPTSSRWRRFHVLRRRLGCPTAHIRIFA